MWWEDKIMRTFRCRLNQKAGVLGNLLSDIGKADGYLGEIKTLRMGNADVERDIVVFADDLNHMERLARLVRQEPNVELLEIRDEVMEMHQGGKIAIRSRYRIEDLNQLRRVYTPGVAEICLQIQKKPELARRFTSISHFVAIVTDGTAVLGLGDIGPQAAMPVMEGKASLMESLVGLSGVPILINSKDVDEIVNTVINIAPTFSAIQLEDISAPRCFEIERRLVESLEMPIMHDDQHGTGVVVTAALLNAAKMAGVKLNDCCIGQIGLGASGFAISRMLMHIFDHPVLGADLDKQAMERLEREGGQASSLEEIMRTCQVVISTTGVPGLIKPEMVQKGQIILAISNPKPEIEPEEALAAGAAFAADGKSVNNILGFPGIFRGSVDADVPRISQEMLFAAARAISESASPGELVPNPLDRKAHLRVSRAVARTAMEQKLNRADLAGYFEES
jgi:malate dehydrogenase (oxaloacetate-decarboxylating)